MKSLSIALKLWLPAISVSIALVAMASGSALRTIRSQAVTVAEQSEQQSKLEMSARWYGVAQAQALRGIGAVLASEPAGAQFLLAGKEAGAQEEARLESELGRLMQSDAERAALARGPTQGEHLESGDYPCRSPEIRRRHVGGAHAHPKRDPV